MVKPNNIFDGSCLYVLTDSADFADDRQAPQLRQRIKELVAGGAKFIQLRDKSLSDRQLVEVGRLMKSQLTGAKTQFIMNDRADLAVACDADGVHLGQDDILPADARKILGEGKWIGLSTHSLSQVRQAVDWAVDYIGVGPVFPSVTKTFSEYVGVELLEQLSREIEIPSFAIGGIDAQNVSQIVAAGFRRIAVSSAVIQARSVKGAAEKLVWELSRVV